MCERGFFCLNSRLCDTKIIRLVYTLTNFLVDVSIVVYTSVINIAGLSIKQYLWHIQWETSVFLPQQITLFQLCVFTALGSINELFWTW
jgi:hypothetical protein